MADDDDINLMDDGGVAAPEKKKGLGGLLPGLLKWIIIGLAAVIVIVVVSLITYSIISSRNPPTAGVPSDNEDYLSANREEYSWYTSLGMIQTTTCDDPPATVQVDVALGYTLDDKATANEITVRTVELKAFLRRYFHGKTFEDLNDANNELGLANEIKNGINDKVLSKTKIRAVEFQTLNVNRL